MNMSKFIAALSGKALKALAGGAASLFAVAVVDKLLTKDDDVDPIELKPEKEDVEVADDVVVQTDVTEEVNEN